MLLEEWTKKSLLRTADVRNKKSNTQPIKYEAEAISIRLLLSFIGLSIFMAHCTFYLKGDSSFFRNVGTYLPKYTVTLNIFVHIQVVAWKIWENRDNSQLWWVMNRPRTVYLLKTWVEHYRHSNLFTMPRTVNTLKNSVFWDITPCSPSKINWRFGEICRLHRQSRRISQAIKQRESLFATCFTLVSCLSYSSTLKMEVTCSSETSVDFRRTTRRYIPEDRALHNHRCENFKSLHRRLW
jgi:hypothetical protein